MLTNTPKRKFNPVDLRPTVEIFGKKYKLPYYSASIGDNFTQETMSFDIRKVIDEAYPDIERPEMHMLYLHLLRESKKAADGSYLIKDTRKVEINGILKDVSMNDIKRVQKSEHEYDGAKYVFRVPSGFELVKAGIEVSHQATLNYLLQHVEYDGEKYNSSEIEGGLPLAFCYAVPEIIGELILEADKTYTGIDEIEKFFLNV